MSDSTLYDLIDEVLEDSDVTDALKTMDELLEDD